MTAEKFEIPSHDGPAKRSKEFRYNFDKPFRRRAWFWVWLAIIIADIAIVGGAMLEAYRDPCTMSYGTIVCANSGFERVAVAIMGGFVSSAFVFFSNLCPLALWSVWTFGIKRQLRKEQAQKDAAKAAMTKSDELPPAP